MFLVKYNDSKRILSLPIFIFTFGDYGTLDLVPRLGNHDTNYEIILMIMMTMMKMMKMMMMIVSGDGGCGVLDVRGRGVA